MKIAIYIILGYLLLRIVKMFRRLIKHIKPTDIGIIGDSGYNVGSE